MKFRGISDVVFVSVPAHLGRTIGVSLSADPSLKETEGIEEAAEAICATYHMAIENLE